MSTRLEQSPREAEEFALGELLGETFRICSQRWPKWESEVNQIISQTLEDAGNQFQEGRSLKELALHLGKRVTGKVSPVDLVVDTIQTRGRMREITPRSDGNPENRYFETGTPGLILRMDINSSPEKTTENYWLIGSDMLPIIISGQEKKPKEQEVTKKDKPSSQTDNRGGLCSGPCIDLHKKPFSELTLGEKLLIEATHGGL